MMVKADPSGCLESVRPRPECEGRPRAKSTVSTTESMRYSVAEFRESDANAKKVMLTDDGARELLVDKLEEIG